MCRKSYAGLLLALGCAALAWADDPVVFHSDVSLVRVQAQVVDRSNRTIPGLGPRDFVVRDSGRPQKIQSVDSENLPIDLLLLLDVSASMRPHIQRISTAAHDAFRQMRDEDRIAIMVFDRSSRVRMGFRNRNDAERELERLLDDETFRGGTDITLGMYDAADFIGREGRPEARKAIVIVTDDATERNRDDQGVLRSLTRADAVLSALIAPDAMSYRRGGYGGGYPQGGGGYPSGGGGPLGGIILGRPRTRYPGGGGGYGGSHTQSAGTREIALRSGGDSMPVDDSYALQDTLERIRQRYSLNFYLPEGARAGEERFVTVELADAVLNRFPGAQVHYRQSYIAPQSTGGAGGAPPVISSAPSDSDRPILRRPAVSQPDSSGGGPLIRDDAPATGDAPAPPPAQSASPAPPARSSPDQSGGWRKARPDELPAK